MRRDILVEQEGLCGLDDARGQPLAKLERRRKFTELIGKLDEVRLPVVECYVDNVGVERLAHLLAHQLDECVEFQFRGERLADPVDGRHLCRTLARLPQQAIRLVKQPRVFQRDADVERDRRQHARIRLGERVLAIHVLERDGALTRAADNDHSQPRFGGTAREDDCRMQRGFHP
jgi:hypothetical protein